MKLDVEGTVVNGRAPTGVDAMVVDQALRVVRDRLDRIPETEVPPVPEIRIALEVSPHLTVQERAALVADHLLVAIETRLVGAVTGKQPGVLRRWWAALTGKNAGDSRVAKLRALEERNRALDKPARENLRNRLMYDFLSAPAVYVFVEGKVPVEFLCDALGEVEVGRYVNSASYDPASVLWRVHRGIELAHQRVPDETYVTLEQVQGEWNRYVAELTGFSPALAEVARRDGPGRAERVALELTYYRGVVLGLADAKAQLAGTPVPSWVLDAKGPGDAIVLGYLAGERDEAETIRRLGVAPPVHTDGKTEKDPTLHAIERVALYARLLRRRADLARLSQRTEQQSLELRAVHGALEILAHGRVGSEFSTGTNSSIFAGMKKTGGQLLSKAELQQRAVVTNAGEGARFGGSAADPHVYFGRGQEGLGTARAYGTMNAVEWGYLSPPSLTDAELDARIARNENALRAMQAHKSEQIGIMKPYNIQRDAVEADYRACVSEKARRQNDPAYDRPYPVVLSLDLDQTFKAEGVGRGGAGAALGGEVRVKTPAIDLAKNLEFVFVPQDKVADARRRLDESVPGNKAHVCSLEALDLIADLSVERALKETHAASIGALTRNAYFHRFLAEEASETENVVVPKTVEPLWQLNAPPDAQGGR